MKVPDIAGDEVRRLSILRQYDILDTLPEAEFDDIVFLASQICGTPVALISLVDESRQWFKAKRGLSVSETPRDISFCAHAILEDKVFVVPDSALDERFHDNPLVTSEPLIRFYAGAPLKCAEGQNIGTLCVIDHKPHQLSESQVLALQALARQVVSHLEFRRNSESIRRAAKLLQICPAAIFCRDYGSGKGTFSEWNAAAEDLWDLKRSDVLGRLDSEIFDPDQAARNRNSDLEVLRTGQQVYIPHETITTMKGRKELRTWKVPVIDGKGDARFVLGISLDITQQVEAERLVKEARSRAETAATNLDLALEGASLGIWDWDLTTNQVNFDRRWCEMLGLIPDQTPMELKTWEERVHPDDLAQCYQDIQSYMRGESLRYENIHRMRHANGEWIYILDRGRFSAWDRDGKPIRFTGTHLDISDLQRSKKELQEARKRLEEAEITGRFGSWKLDLLNGESIWSRGHNHIFDFNEDEAVPSFEAFLSCLDPQETAKLLSLYEDLKAGRILHFETDYRVLTQTGSTRYVKSIGDVQLDADQRPIAVIGTVQDITSLKLMELSLIESREAAIAATKTKSRFLANMSHEIRTPLNGVVGSAVLLIETELSPEQRELAEIIKSSSDSLLALIDDILDFSKIEAGKLNIELLPFDPRATIREAVRIISRRAAEKALALEVQVSDGLPDVIVSDPYRFRQILLNLLSNAVKFTDAGHVKLRASHIMVSESSLELLVSIEDSGIGMTQDEQQRLFRDFSQVDGSSTRKFGGTGLGLAISKQLCSLLGGTIEVQSEPGQGSIFSIKIPATVAEGQASAHINPPLKLESIGAGKYQGLRVLVAEDNKINQTIVLQFLKKHDIQADLVDNGRDAVEAAIRGTYDLIFMDVHMPTLDGFDATRRIRASLPSERQPHIVALTANAMTEDKEQCLAVGMDGFLRKPLDARELSLVLNKLCSEPRNRQDNAPPSCFNAEVVLVRFYNDLEIFQHASGLFLVECNQRLREIQDSLDKLDARSLKKVLHSFKGAACYFSTGTVTDLAEKMETLAGEGSLEEVRTLFPRLKAEVEELGQAIARYLETRKSA